VARLPERVSVSSLLEVVSDDLLKLNNNLKAVSVLSRSLLIKFAQDCFAKDALIDWLLGAHIDHGMKLRRNFFRNML
jgi:hypothetical protein